MNDNDTRLVKILGGAQDVAFMAFRYYLPRHSAGAADFASRMLTAVPLFSQEHQEMIYREIMEEVDRNDRATKDYMKHPWIDRWRAVAKVLNHLADQR